VRLANLLNLGKHAFVTAADEQNPAAEFDDLKPADDLDCVRGAERQIQNHQIGVASGHFMQELLGRNEMTRADSDRAEHFANDRSDQRLIIKHEGQAYADWFLVKSQSR
jgi:hypothetical protein